MDSRPLQRMTLLVEARAGSGGDPSGGAAGQETSRKQACQVHRFVAGLLTGNRN